MILDVEGVGIAVDYPKSDLYKLVIISNLVENSNLFYKFHLLSLDRSSSWQEFELIINTFTFLSFSSPSI